MFILLYGPNTFLSRQQLRKSMEDFQKQRDPGGFNTVVFDAEKIEPARILEALTASPFLAEKRLVAVEKLSAVKDKEFLDAFWQMAEKKKLPETTVAIFWEKELSEKKLPDFFVFLKKQKYSKFFGNFSEKELSGWIKKKFDAEGLIISFSALAYLLAHPIVKDLWQLENELNKIIAYALARNSKEISLEILNIFLPGPADDNTFHFIDALVAKNSGRAIKLLHEQWATGAAEPQVFGALVWQFKTLLLIKDYLNFNPGTMSEAAAKNLSLSPYVVRKAFGILKNFQFEALKNIYSDLLEIDKKVKTGEGDYRLFLDLLVNRICQR